MLATIRRVRVRGQTQMARMVLRPAVTTDRAAATLANKPMQPASAAKPALAAERPIRWQTQKNVAS